MYPSFQRAIMEDSPLSLPQRWNFYITEGQEWKLPFVVSFSSLGKLCCFPLGVGLFQVGVGRRSPTGTWSSLGTVGDTATSQLSPCMSQNQPLPPRPTEFPGGQAFVISISVPSLCFVKILFLSFCLLFYCFLPPVLKEFCEAYLLLLT